jgi:hypothetical protein
MRKFDPNRKNRVMTEVEVQDSKDAKDSIKKKYPITRND